MYKVQATFQRIILILLSLAFSFLLIETIVRLSGVWVKANYDDRNYFAPTPIEKVPYALKPGCRVVWARTKIISNSDGIRCEHDVGPKTKGTYRILVMGDSITFGFGVDQQEAYPQQMEELLNDLSENPQFHYEVINAGIEGFNLENEVHLLKFLEQKYQPDLVLWLVVSNDWDDSLSLNSDGKLTTSKADYAATSEWLEFSWGLAGSFLYEDFFQCMDPVHQNWALGKPYVENKSALDRVDSLLQDISYAYCFFQSRQWRFRDAAPRPASGQKSWKRRVEFTATGGFQDLLPEIKSIYLSPHFKSRFYNNILEGIETVLKGGTRLVIYGLNIMFEKDQISKYSSTGVTFQDISQYLGMSYEKFRQSYNLGWDGHFNRSGNKTLAESMIQSLVDLGILRQLAVHPRRRVYNKDQYWKQAEINRRELVDSFLLPFVDFRKFTGIFQLVGGLYPPRVFPIKEGSPITLILRRDNHDTPRIYISGENFTQIGHSVAVSVGDGLESFSETREWLPGKVQFSLRLSDVLTKSHNEIFDVQLRCLSSRREALKLDYVGLIQNEN